MKIKGFVLMVGLAALLVVPGIVPMSAAATNSTLTVGVVGIPYSTFMQSTTTGFGTLAQFPYLYCYQFGFAGVAEPDLCNVPSAVAGSNDTKWVVNLRSPDYKWSDGAPINSTDLAYSFGIYLSNGPYANLSAFDIWGNLRGTVQNISVLNSTAIQLNTAAPDPLFTMLTWLYPVYPYHYYKQFTGNNTLQTTAILGGPGDSAYIPQGYTANSDVLTAVANPNSPSWNGTTPTIKTVVFDFFTTDSAQVNALASGQIDSGMITSSDAQTLASISALKTTSLPSNQQMLFFINPASYPYNNTAFRQAMMYLVPKVQINELLYNNQSTLGNPLLLSPNALPTYWPSASTPTYNYNTTAAIALLKSAGLTKNSGGNWAMSNGTALTVQFVAPNNDPDVVRAAQQIASSLQNVGLKVNLQIVDYNTATNDKYTKPNSYGLVLYPDSYFPSPFKWMRNPVNLPSAWSNSTFTADFSASLANPNSTAALSELKSALNVLAESAVTNSILYEPLEAAYNTQAFTNWQPALNNAGNYDVFYYPVFSEQVLAAVHPSSGSSATVSSSSSSSSTATVSSSAPSTSSSSSSSVSASASSGPTTSSAVSSSAPPTTTATTAPATSTTTTSSSSTSVSPYAAVGMAGVVALIAVAYAGTVSRRSGRWPRPTIR